MAGSREIFEDTMRPAEMLVRVYRLLENERVETFGEMIQAIRSAVGGKDDEQCLLIYNEIFVGLVRERADIPATAFKSSALDNLLRQAVVASCTALETFLPSLLRSHLANIIELKGRSFFPDDEEIREYFSALTFDLPYTLRLIQEEEDPFFHITNKILGLTTFKYLGSSKGVHAVGALLQLEKTWDQIANKLGRDRRELMKVIDETTRRRNDIVHRADRPQTDPGGDQQTIGFAWTKQAVDTIRHVCLALDELVTARFAELSKPPEKPIISSGQIMERLGLSPGPVVGQAIKVVAKLKEADPGMQQADAERRLDNWWTQYCTVMDELGVEPGQVVADAVLFLEDLEAQDSNLRKEELDERLQEWWKAHPEYPSEEAVELKEEA